MQRSTYIIVVLLEVQRYERNLFHQEVMLILQIPCKTFFVVCAPKYNHLAKVAIVVPCGFHCEAKKPK